MKKWQYFSLIIAISLIVFYLVRNLDGVKQIRNASPWIIFYLIVINLIARVVVGFKVKIIAAVFNVNLTVKEWFGIAAIQAFYNYLFTKSGLLANALYINKKYDIPLPSYIAAFASAQMFGISVGGLMGLLASIYAKTQGHDLDILIPLFSFLLVIPLALVFFPKLNLFKGKRFHKLDQILQGWSIIRRSKNLWGILVLCEFVILSLLALRYFMAIQAFGYNVPLWVCFLLAPVNSVANVISIVPGALGIKEAAAGLLTQISGFGMEVGILTTLLDRVVVMLIAIILGSIFSYLLLKEVNNKMAYKPL